MKIKEDKRYTEKGVKEKCSKFAKGSKTLGDREISRLLRNNKKQVL